MQAISELIVLDETVEATFAFLSGLNNLPQWATEYCDSGRWDGDTYKALTGHGEMITRVEANAATGVIDMWGGPTEAELELFPLRVIPLPENRCALSFIFFQGPDLPDELFARQHASLRKELAALPAVLRAAREDAAA